MVNSTVMNTVSDLKKYLKSCVDQSTIVVPNDNNENVLIKLAYTWLRNHQCPHHIYIAWFAIRELLQSNFKGRHPEVSTVIESALKYFDDFVKAEKLQLARDYTIKDNLHENEDCYYITTAYKICAVAGVMRNYGIVNGIDFSLPEGKEYNGILDSDDVVVDNTVQQKSTYEMIRDLKKYLRECVKKNEIIPYQGSCYVDLVDIAICIMNKIRKQSDGDIKDIAYAVWLSMFVWFEFHGNNNIKTLQDIYDLYDFEAKAEILDNVKLHAFSYGRCHVNPYEIRVNTIRNIFMRINDFLPTYIDTTKYIKPIDTINIDWRLEEDDCIKDKHDEIVDALITLRDNMNGIVDALIAFRDKLKEIVDVLKSLEQNQAK